MTCNPPLSDIVLKLKNNGISDHTVRLIRNALRYLDKHADLDKPEEVKQYIAEKTTSNAYKGKLCYAYNKYCLHENIAWKQPYYKQEPKMTRIPTTEQINTLINCSGKKSSTMKLTLSKETGLRPVELCNLRVRDVDLDQKIIYPTTAKNGIPRRLKINSHLQAMLRSHIKTHNLKPEDKLFRGNAENYGKQFRKYRNKLSIELDKPELKSITLYSFRHYFATRLYSKTRDILLVKQQMGHKKIETTLIYTQLINFNDDDEWTCKATTNTNEATQLIENGFEYVATTPDALMLFRKRK